MAEQSSADPVSSTDRSPQTCRHCSKGIVKDPGVDRYRSTDLNIAVDRMKCDVASDHHHQPVWQDAMQRVVVHVPPTESEVRAGDLS